VAVKVDFAAGVDSDRIEAVSSEIDEALRKDCPMIKHVFLDATTASAEQQDISREVVKLAQADADGDTEAADRLAEVEKELQARSHG
jgi:endo-beta-N-acetylglucosaminidase D